MAGSWHCYWHLGQVPKVAEVLRHTEVDTTPTRKQRLDERARQKLAKINPSTKLKLEKVTPNEKIFPGDPEWVETAKPEERRVIVPPGRPYKGASPVDQHEDLVDLENETKLLIPNEPSSKGKLTLDATSAETRTWVNLRDPAACASAAALAGTGDTFGTALGPGGDTLVPKGHVAQKVAKIEARIKDVKAYALAPSRLNERVVPTPPFA